LKESDSQVRIHDKDHFYARIKTMRSIDSMAKNKGFSSKLFTRKNLMELFLIIANFKESKEDMFQMFDELVEYQKDLGEIHFTRPEINFLNKFLITKHYNMSYYISKIYVLLYNNSIVRKLYRSFNNATQ